MKWLVAAGVVGAFFVTVHPARAQGSDACVEGQRQLTLHQLEKARDAFLDVLANDEKSPCAASGLAKVRVAEHREAQLCTQGGTLSESGLDDAAQAKYVEALGENVVSKCATKGLSGLDDTGLWGGVDDVVGYAPKITAALAAAGAVLLVPLIVGGVLLIGVLLWSRRRRSLTVRDFQDGSVTAKVGSAVTALVQQRLVGLERSAARATPEYDLDLVVADVELLAENDDLASAVGGLAQVPQLQLVAALLSAADRIFNRRLDVAGELLLAGSEGPGVALALYRRDGMRARGALWEGEVASWFSPNGTPASRVVAAAPQPTLAGPHPLWAAVVRSLRKWFGAGESASHASSPSPDPAPYYNLAVPAASWIQYEVARSLDTNVALITSSPPSFTLVGVALELQRDDDTRAALDAYARALEFDSDNVAALVNAAALLARKYALYMLAIAMLDYADAVLEQRYASLT
jgi:tetratricopeptide (TPR) repeat protein